MISRPGRLALALLLLLASRTYGQSIDETTAPVPTKPPIFLAWADKYFARNDEALVDLIGALKELLPVEGWPTVTVDEQRALMTLIDDYYDIYEKENPEPDDPGFPKAAAALIELIRQANGKTGEELQKGEVVCIPPLPVLAQRKRKAYRNIIRFFDHRTHTYAIARDLYKIPETGEYALVKVNPMTLEEERSAYMTVVRLSKDEYNRAFPLAFLRKYRSSLLMWEGTQENESIYPALVATLFENAETAPQLPDRSPYLENVKRRVSAMTAEERTAALARVENRPLVLVDWNFHDGHGRQVRAVVDLLLEELDLTFLATGRTRKTIIEIDLDRTREQARDDLLNRLGRYRVSKEVDFNQAFSSAERWIQSGINSTSTPLVDQLVLSAIFWEYFRQERPPAIMNFSFGLAVGGGAEDAAALHDNPTTVAFIAAGNGKGPAEALFPQKVGQQNPLHFVNVTYGTDKEILGRSSTRPKDSHRLFVPLLAPGSGFADRAGILTPEHEGSSLAAPYVAASAWIKHALDGTEPRTLRKELMRATRPVRAFEEAIKSIGFFDPGLLLSPRPAVVVRADGTVTPIASARVEIEVPLWPVDVEPPPQWPEGVEPTFRRTLLTLDDTRPANAVLLIGPCEQSERRNDTIVATTPANGVLCVSTWRLTDDADDASFEPQIVRKVDIVLPNGMSVQMGPTADDKADQVVQIWGTKP